MPDGATAPVVLFVFNRPALAARVFARIREARPSRLFVVADGPREGFRGDLAHCGEARRVTEEVDWPCDVDRLYADTNLGIKRNVERGLAQTFHVVNEAIVLEDDCVPDPSFFPFCTELLARYRGEERVLTIGGTSFADAASGLGAAGSSGAGGPSYRFSRYPLIWGWATWRRAWSHYDGALAGWAGARGPWLASFLGDPMAERYWSYVFEEEVRAGAAGNWDHAWVLSSWRRNGLSIVPAVNLVSNAGFGPDGTHCTDPRMAGSNLPAGSLGFPLRHPDVLARDEAADAALEAVMFGGRVTRLLAEVKRRVTARRVS